MVGLRNTEKDLAVLVDKLHVAVRLGQHQAGRAGGRLVDYRLYGNAFGIELPLDFPHVVERLDVLRVFVPARIGGLLPANVP